MKVAPNPCFNFIMLRWRPRITANHIVCCVTLNVCNMATIQRGNNVPTL